MMDIATERLEKQSLDPKDFEVCLGESVSPFVSSKIKQANFRFRELSSEEFQTSLREIFDVLLNRDLEKSGAHRRGVWERGWGENLDEAQKKFSASAIVPKYFHKFSQVRWMGRLIQPLSEKFEYHMLEVIQYWIFEKYLKSCSSIYEFGCGTGHNLLRMREVNPHARLYGLDWAQSSQKIIDRMREEGILSHVSGHQFNYFEPDMSFDLDADGAVVTVASLEQVGSNFESFLDYLLQKKPKICIHLEPIAELLDDARLFDYLSVQYFKKRNYLTGFLSSLRRREREGQLKILKAERTWIGSFFIEGYSVVVWMPGRDQ